MLKCEPSGRASQAERATIFEGNGKFYSPFTSTIQIFLTLTRMSQPWLYYAFVILQKMSTFETETRDDFRLFFAHLNVVRHLSLESEVYILAYCALSVGLNLSIRLQITDQNVLFILHEH